MGRGGLLSSAYLLSPLDTFVLSIIVNFVGVPEMPTG